MNLIEAISSIIGQYNPVPGQYGVGSWDIPYILSTIFLMIIVYSLFRFIATIFKGGR